MLFHKRTAYLSPYTPCTQCCDNSKSTSDILLGENQVPVQDLLTALKEIHLMNQGKLAGKIIVDSASLGNVCERVCLGVLALHVCWFVGVVSLGLCRCVDSCMPAVGGCLQCMNRHTKQMLNVIHVHRISASAGKYFWISRPGPECNCCPPGHFKRH